MTDMSAGDRTPNRRSSDRPALVVAALALVAVVGLSTLVGFFGAPHGEDFSWEIASIFGIALGTTLLAAATGWLAWSTRSEVRATQDLAELTRRQQVASERPVVLLKRSASFSGSPENGVLSFELHNVGLGPALRVRVSATYTGHENWQPSITPATIAVIEPGVSLNVELAASFPQPNAPGGVVGGAFTVRGDYLDRSMLNAEEIITSWPEEEGP